MIDISSPRRGEGPLETGAVRPHAEVAGERRGPA